MRAAAAALGAYLLLSFFGLNPFRANQVETLLPVQVLTVTGGRTVRLETDNGLAGEGPDYLSAMARLKASAPGQAFFGTCGAVVLCPGARAEDAASDPDLRPNTAVFRCARTPPAGELPQRLSQEEGGLSLLQLRQGSRDAPWLIQTEGGWLCLGAS